MSLSSIYIGSACEEKALTSTDAREALIPLTFCFIFYLTSHRKANMTSAAGTNSGLSIKINGFVADTKYEWKESS